MAHVMSFLFVHVAPICVKVSTPSVSDGYQPKNRVLLIASVRIPRNSRH